MFTKKVLVSALLAAGMIGAVATPLPGVAATSFDIQLNFGPPPVRYEAIPAARAGYVWSPGHWQWSGSAYRHDWVPGHWERARTGYAYHAPSWTERNGRWHYAASRWDRDGDGVSNNLDRTPDGVGVAPPARRNELVPAARVGYAWSPGHWGWRSGRHDWIAGNWVAVRTGYTYHAPQWVERNGRWHFEARRWDRDGDGTPNRLDPTPLGANRPGDRDGDGVPNRRDVAPNNPNRS